MWRVLSRPRDTISQALAPGTSRGELWTLLLCSFFSARSLLFASCTSFFQSWKSTDGAATVAQGPSCQGVVDIGRYKAVMGALLEGRSELNRVKMDVGRHPARDNLAETIMVEAVAWSVKHSKS